MLQITRYQKTRFWALWDGSELVAVVVYEEGRRGCGLLPEPARFSGQAAARKAAVGQALSRPRQRRATRGEP